MAFAGELFHFFQHRRNCAVEAGSGLREETDRGICVLAARDAEMLYIRSSERFDFLPPVVGRDVKVYGAHEIADSAALVGVFDAAPKAVKLSPQQVWLIEYDGSVGKQVENRAVGSGHGCVKFPAGKNRDSAGAHGGFYDFFRS